MLDVLLWLAETEDGNATDVKSDAKADDATDVKLDAKHDDGTASLRCCASMLSDICLVTTVYCDRYSD